MADLFKRFISTPLAKHRHCYRTYHMIYRLIEHALEKTRCTVQQRTEPARSWYLDVRAATPSGRSVQRQGRTPRPQWKVQHLLVFIVLCISLLFVVRWKKHILTTRLANKCSNFEPALYAYLLQHPHPRHRLQTVSAETQSMQTVYTSRCVGFILAQGPC